MPSSAETGEPLGQTQWGYVRDAKMTKELTNEFKETTNERLAIRRRLKFVGQFLSIHPCPGLAIRARSVAIEVARMAKPGHG